MRMVPGWCKCHLYGGEEFLCQRLGSYLRLLHRDDSCRLGQSGFIFPGNPVLVEWTVAVGIGFLFRYLGWHLFLLYDYDPECVEFRGVFLSGHPRLVVGIVAGHQRFLLRHLDWNDE